jgi:hypothetical protein
MTAVEQTPTPTPTAAHDDAAWVRIETSMPAADLRVFIHDVERLYRINPLLEIAAFELVEANRYHLVALNQSNGVAIDVALSVTATEGAVEVAYGSGLKTATHFRVEAAPAGAHLFVTDLYGGGSADERRARAAEVDLSLNAWGRALHSYLAAWARWRWLAPWRWYMRRVWQPMKPSSRRIVWMIWVISGFEMFAVVVLLVTWSILRMGPL